MDKLIANLEGFDRDPTGQPQLMLQVKRFRLKYVYIDRHSVGYIEKLIVNLEGLDRDPPGQPQLMLQVKRFR